jgi:hypothetical protein
VEQGPALDVAELTANQGVENAIAVEELGHPIAVTTGLLGRVDVDQIVPVGLVGFLMLGQIVHDDSAGNMAPAPGFGT